MFVSHQCTGPLLTFLKRNTPMRKKIFIASSPFAFFVMPNKFQSLGRGTAAADRHDFFVCDSPARRQPDAPLAEADSCETCPTRDCGVESASTHAMFNVCCGRTTDEAIARTATRLETRLKVLLSASRTYHNRRWFHQKLM